MTRQSNAESSVGVWQNPGSYLPTWAQCLESGCVNEAGRDGRCDECGGSR